MGVQLTKLVMVLADQEEGGHLSGCFISTYKMDPSFDFAHHLLAFGEDIAIMERLPPPHPPVNFKEKICEPEVFAMIDQFAARIPKQYLLAPHYQVGRLVQDNIEHHHVYLARFVYQWITSLDINTFPVEEYDIPDWRTLMYQLWRIKVGKGTWAQMVSFLCRMINLPCVIVHGKVKNGYYRVGKCCNMHDYYGEWNAVLLGGDWWLMDCYLGAYGTEGDLPPDEWTLIETGEDMEPLSRTTESSHRSLLSLKKSRSAKTAESSHRSLLSLTKSKSGKTMESSHRSINTGGKSKSSNITSSNLSSNALTTSSSSSESLGSEEESESEEEIVAEAQKMTTHHRPLDLKTGIEPTVVHRYSEHYFMANPAHMVATHMPAVPEWQLMHRQMPETYFDSMVYMGERFFDMDMGLVSHPRAFVFACQEAEIILSYPEEKYGSYRFAYRLLREDTFGKGSSVGPLVTTERWYPDCIEFKLRAPYDGLFRLEIQGLDSQCVFLSEEFLPICHYIIKVDTEPLTWADKRIFIAEWMGQYMPMEDFDHLFEMDAAAACDMHDALKHHRSLKYNIFLNTEKTYWRNPLVKTLSLTSFYSTDSSEDFESRTYTRDLLKEAEIALGGVYGFARRDDVYDMEAKKEDLKSESLDIPSALEPTEDRTLEEIEETFEDIVDEADTDDLERLVVELELMEKPEKTGKFIAMCMRRIEIYDCMGAIEEAIAEKDLAILTLLLSQAHERDYLTIMGEDYTVEVLDIQDRMVRMAELENMACSVPDKEIFAISRRDFVPENVHRVFKACFFLLGNSRDDLDEWPKVQELMEMDDPDSLKVRIQNFKPVQCPKDDCYRASLYIEDVNEYLVKITNPYAHRFFLWLMGMIAEVETPRLSRPAKMTRKQRKYDT